MDPRVFEAMRPYLTMRFGNAASLNHSFGWEAQDACELAREQIAAVIHAQAAKEIIFTSGREESNWLAIKGVALAYADKGHHIITSTAAAASVHDACRALSSQGYRTTCLAHDRAGRLDPRTVKAAVKEQTILISLPIIDHNTGFVLPMAEIGSAAKDAEVLLHADAAGAFGNVSVHVQEMDIDLLTISEPGGPRGVGALYVRGRRPRVRLMPLMDGGGQERGWRSGTLNVPGIVGLAAVCILREEEREKKMDG